MKRRTGRKVTQDGARREWLTVPGQRKGEKLAFFHEETEPGQAPGQRSLGRGKISAKPGCVAEKSPAVGL